METKTTAMARAMARAIAARAGGWIEEETLSEWGEHLFLFVWEEEDPRYIPVAEWFSATDIPELVSGDKSFYFATARC